MTTRSAAGPLGAAALWIFWALATAVLGQTALDAVDGRRREVDSQLENVKVRLVTLTSQYEELERQKDENVQASRASEEEIAALTLKQQRGLESLNQIKLELAQAETAYGEHIERFTKGLSQFYWLRNRPYLTVLFSSKDMSDRKSVV